MPAPFYQNQNEFNIIVPTHTGIDILVAPDKVVQGTYYEKLDYSLFLTEVAGPYVWPDLIYTYPEDANGTGGVDSITATPPLSATGTTDVTIALSGEIDISNIGDGTITAVKIADGEVVKSINTLTDDITLAAGTGISLTPVNNTITIENTAPAVASATGTPPLTLTLVAGDLTGSIDITATDDGGAVALQSSPTTEQTGNIHISGTITAESFAGKYRGKTQVFTVGSYDIVNYLTVSTFVVDAVDGVVTFNLPELTASSDDGEILIFKKIDSTTNAVHVAPDTGQTIDTLSQVNISIPQDKLIIQSVIDTNNSLYYWITI